MMRLHYLIKFYWFRLAAALIGQKVCPYCWRVTQVLRECPTCHVAQCGENCYEDWQSGEQCGACEYPEC